MFQLRRLLWKKFQNSMRSYGCETFEKYKHSCTHLKTLPKEEVQTFFGTFLETIISDADGVLWLHENPIEGSMTALNHLTACGKRIFIVTNNSTRTREYITKKACSMGLNIEEEQIICLSYATVDYLKSLNFQKRAFILGAKGLAAELSKAGLKYSTVGIGADPMPTTMKILRENLNLENDVGAVVVGFDGHFSYPKMAKACVYLLQDPKCLFIVTNRDEQIPTPTVMLPGTGSFAAALEVGSERRATLIGKPSAQLVWPLIKKGCVNPERTLMIGDRGSTDMLFGYNCGFYTLFVGTGTNSLQDVRNWQTSKDCELQKMIPDFYLPRLGDLCEILCD